MASHKTASSSAMRKEAQQARSRTTIDAILDASALILGRSGWAALTTNAAAEVAGVSIGSLYQYFPNKFALLEAVRHRHLTEVLTVLRAAADTKIARKNRIAALADGMIAVHDRYPAAYRVLLEESPRGEDTRDTYDFFEAECRRAYEAIFKANAHRATDERMAAHVLAGAAAGAVHEAARQGTLTSPAFRRELLLLIGSYLSKR